MTPHRDLNQHLGNILDIWLKHVALHTIYRTEKNIYISTLYWPCTWQNWGPFSWNCSVWVRIRKKTELVSSSLHLPLTTSNGYAYGFVFLKSSKYCTLYKESTAVGFAPQPAADAGGTFSRKWSGKKHRERDTALCCSHWLWQLRRSEAMFFLVIDSSPWFMK